MEKGLLMPLIQYGQFTAVIQSLTRITESEDTRITEAGDIRITEETATDSAGVSAIVAEATKFNLISEMYVKDNGFWKLTTPYVKYNGSWQEPIIYIKISGDWKRVY